MAEERIVSDAEGLAREVKRVTYSYRYATGGGGRYRVNFLWKDCCRWRKDDKYGTPKDLLVRAGGPSGGTGGGGR